jgi:hypothetical protein
MSVEEDVAALLDQVEAYHQGECAKLLKEANRQAESLVRAAHREARQRVHVVLAELRRDARAHIVASEARAQARLRNREHRATLALLEAGWARLTEELSRRWRDPEARAIWVKTLAERALASLPAEKWLIRHPADWPEGERQRLAEALAGRLAEPPEWLPDSGIAAGLHLCAGGAPERDSDPQGDTDPLRTKARAESYALKDSDPLRAKARAESYALKDSDPLRAKARAESYACVDGTLEGLLGSREAVEAALLGYLEEAHP